VSKKHSYFMHHMCYSSHQMKCKAESQARREGLGSRIEIQKSIWRKTKMAITRWDPFREVVALQNRMNSLFREMNETDSPLSTASFVPAVDIYEDNKKVVLKLEVPGIEEKDLDIRVENNTLTVKGERKFEKEEKEENFHRIERRYGSFFRSFTLPSTVDSEHIGASYNAGVLRLELMKKPEAQPKQIKVNVGGQQKVEAHKEEPELVGAR
jgi:HSP20 family protein